MFILNEMTDLFTMVDPAVIHHYDTVRSQDQGMGLCMASSMNHLISKKYNKVEGATHYTFLEKLEEAITIYWSLNDVICNDTIKCDG